MNMFTSDIKFQQIIKYLLSGGLAALVNIGSRMVLNIWLSYEISIIIAYFFGMVVAFLLMRKTFYIKQNANILPQIVKFCFVNLLSIAQTFLVSLFLFYYFFPFIGIVQDTKVLSHFIGVLFPVFISYFLHKYLTFK